MLTQAGRLKRLAFHASGDSHSAGFHWKQTLIFGTSAPTSWFHREKREGSAIQLSQCHCPQAERDISVWLFGDLTYEGVASTHGPPATDAVSPTPFRCVVIPHFCSQ